MAPMRSARALSSVVALALLAFLALPRAVDAAPITVREARENPVALRLAGIWRPDEALNERRGVVDRSPGAWRRMVFVPDAAVVERLSAEQTATLSAPDMTVYLAGTMFVTRADGETREHIFFLIEYQGHSRILYFRTQASDTYLVSLAVAPDPADDILFIAGDHATNPAEAYARE